MWYFKKGLVLRKTAMKNLLNNLINRKLLKSFTLFLLLGNLSACTSYKSNWSCSNAQGIGCSSLEYADEVARKQILLNQASLSDISSKQLNTESILLIKTGVLDEEQYIKEQYGEAERPDLDEDIY